MISQGWGCESVWGSVCCGALFVPSVWCWLRCPGPNWSSCSRMIYSVLAWDTAWLISPCGFLLNGISGSGSSPRLSLHSFADLLVAAWFSVPTGLCWLEMGPWVWSVLFGCATGKATGKAIGMDVEGWLVSAGCGGESGCGAHPLASERARTRRSFW